MSFSGVQITGDKEIEAILEDIAPKHARNLMRSTIHGVAARITKGAKARVSRDSGDLRKGIFTKREKSPPHRPTSSVRFKDSVFYWRFVEHGTQKGNNVEARPFLAPARLEVESNLKNILREEFQKKLTKKVNSILKKQAATNGV